MVKAFSGKKQTINLSNTQQDLINLDLSQNWVIQGGPGTGKTVLAVSMAEKIAKDGKKVLAIMYNRPLMQFVQQSYVEHADVEYDVMTYHSWIYSIYSNILGYSMPTDANRQPDWNRIEKTMSKLDLLYHTIIIDEAQDFPKELIHILSILSENIIAFIDPNQIIREGQSDVNSLLDELCEKAPYSLTINYRNTREIGDAAKCFAEQRDDFANVKHDNYPQIIYCSGNEDIFSEQTNIMGELIRKHYGKSIGIIVNFKNVERTLNNLRAELGDIIEVEAYKANTNKNELDFRKNNVKIVSFGTMKGLEFDVVIIPNVDLIRAASNQKIDYHRMYVAMTRARENLYMITTNMHTKRGKWAEIVPIIEENPEYFEIIYNYS